MKKFIFLMLLLIILGAASVKAQVSIGTVNDPHAGAILDLQSNAKGLLLPHVELLDLEILQVGGSNAGEDLTATGMIVYNISPNFCEGVYFWNGSQWRKAGKDYQVKTTGSGGLTITSVPSNEWDAIVAGENVTFKLTEPVDAQFYYWHLDNAYLATTTSPEYTSYFSLGNHKMKVVFDNCLTLTESNSVSFSTQNFSPASMSSSTGGWIRIYNGNDDSPFPYAATSEYVSTGLVAHYDGINNQNINDKTHSSDATVWKDLSGNGYDVTLRQGHDAQTRQDAVAVTNISSQCPNAQWDSNGFLFNDYCYFARVPANPDATNALYNIMPNLPYGNDNYTIESIFDPTSRIAIDGGIVGWGEQGSYLSNSVRFYLMSNNTQPQFMNLWWDSSVSVRFTDPGSTNIKNVAVTYDNAATDENNRTFYYNGTTNSIEYIDPIYCGITTNDCREKINKNTSKRGSFFVGQSVGVNTYDNAPRTAEVYKDNKNRYSNGNKLFSVRVYNRALTPAEIENNYNVDKLRFETPPQVLIGDQQCSSVTVLSPRALTCKVPAMSSGQTAGDPLDIVVNRADGGEILTYDDEFTYK